jgi:hypothetical protein
MPRLLRLHTPSTRQYLVFLALDGDSSDFSVYDRGGGQFLGFLVYDVVPIVRIVRT